VASGTGASQVRQLKVRYITPDDSKKFIEWINNTPANLYDAEVLKYPTLKVVCSYGENGPVAFLPFQRVLMLESLAVNQEAAVIETAQAFRDLVKAAELDASGTQCKEMYFICKDENVLRVAQGHGFERIEFPVVRMRL